MNQDNPTLSRRTALRTVAGATLAGVAGCLNGDDGSSSPASNNGPSGGQGPIQQVSVDEATLAVEFSSDAGIDQINLIQPSGELFGQREVAAGSQRVSFEIGTAYEPGEYTVVALSGEETVAESSISIDPDVRIVEMGIGRNQPEKMWDGTDEGIRKEAFITVENSGTGSDSISKLLFIGDVPYPSDEEGTNYVDDEDVSGIYDPESDAEADDVVVPAGEEITIYSSRSPFAFVPGAGTSCTDDQQTGEFELILITRVSGERVSKTYSIQYSASEDQDNCDISISEA
ncbi:hypothetical protein [Halomicrobium salinisoli]|uniref:hypothetical protein n=1 Tax=Halomicrobium salinisoli TaxID=2878391 RepID=UPI001CEFE15F|nr:hypothetical protein [Halomicrobium salinisoli]